jgi:hypothetical protein
MTGGNLKKKKIYGGGNLFFQIVGAEEGQEKWSSQED